MVSSIGLQLMLLNLQFFFSFVLCLWWTSFFYHGWQVHLYWIGKFKVFKHICSCFIFFPLEAIERKNATKLRLLTLFSALITVVSMVKWITSDLSPLSCARASFVCCCDIVVNVVECGLHPWVLLFHDFVIIHEHCETLFFLSAIEMLLFFSMNATESKGGQAKTQQWQVEGWWAMMNSLLVWVICPILGQIHNTTFFFWKSTIF